MKLKKNLKYNSFNSNDWIEVVARFNFPLLNSFLRTGVQIRNKELKFNNQIKSQLLLNPKIYSLKQELTDLDKEIEKAINKDPNYLFEYFNQIEADCNKYIKEIKYLARACEGKIEKFNMLKLFSKYKEETIKIISHLYPPLSVEKYIIKIIEKGLAEIIDRKKDPHKFNQIIQLLIKPENPSTILERRIKILKLANKLNVREISEKNLTVKRSFKKFNWLNDHTLSLREEALQDFIQEIKNEKKKGSNQELKKIKEDFKKSKKIRKKLEKKYSLQKEIIDLCNLAQRLPNLRAKRLEVILEAAHILKNNLFKNLVDKLNIKDLRKYFYWEIIDLLRGGEVDRKSIEKRTLKHGFFAYLDSVYVFSDQEIKKLTKILAEKKTEITEIRGNVASLGLARGKVRVMLNENSFSEFKQGDVLVTSMTTPDFVPLMKKSVAIITDEGGISCHAAIVSRELKKPCIIGTKIATQVLKDGDEVEVDANEGIIKIIKNYG